MNYNDKDNKNIEIDDMNIKSRLDASLDLSGISVSEDLINRTLEAIRNKASEQQADILSTDDSGNKVKKFIPWNRYVRAFAGVAAAALIIVAGYGLINSTGGKKDSSSNMIAPTSQTADDRIMAKSDAGNAEQNTLFAAETPTDNGSVAYGTQAPDYSAATDSNTADATENNADNAAAQTAPQFSIAADSTLADNGDGSTGSVGTVAPGEASSMDVPKTDHSVTYLNFRDIFLSDPTLVQSLTITDEVNKASVTLTNQDEIADFYTVMDQHQFTNNTDTTAGYNYTVQIITSNQNNGVYTMTVGDEIIINYTDKDVSSTSIYNAVNSALLLQDLQTLFDKYHK